MSRRLAAAAPKPERACELRFHGVEALAEPLLDPCDVRGEPRLHRRHRILRTTSANVSVNVSILRVAAWQARGVRPHLELLESRSEHRHEPCRRPRPRSRPRSWPLCARARCSAGLGGGSGGWAGHGGWGAHHGEHAGQALQLGRAAGAAAGTAARLLPLDRVEELARALRQHSLGNDAHVPSARTGHEFAQT